MKIKEYKKYYCTALAELIFGRVCDARKVKAGIAAVNKKFKHNMAPLKLKACTQCEGGQVGLVVPGKEKKSVTV